MTNGTTSISRQVPSEQATDILLPIDHALDNKIETLARQTHQEKEEVICQSLERGLDTLIARSTSS